MLERGYCYAAMTSSPFKSSFSCFHPTARRPLLCLGLLSPLSKVRGNEGRSCCAPYFNFEGGSLYSYACNVGLLTKIGKPGASFEVTLYSLEKRMKRNKKNCGLCFIRPWKDSICLRIIPVVVNVRKLCRIQNTGVRFVRKSRRTVRGEHQVEKWRQ